MLRSNGDESHAGNSTDLAETDTLLSVAGFSPDLRNFLSGGLACHLPRSELIQRWGPLDPMFQGNVNS